MWIGFAYGPDWLQYIGLVIVVLAPIVALASALASARTLPIVLGVVACAPIAFIIWLMYRLSQDTS